MLTETVLVKKIDGENIIVELNKHGACSCCKTPFLCSNTGPREITIKNNSALRISAGDTLEVGMEERFTIAAAIAAFGVPTLILLSIIYALRESGALISFMVAIAVIFVYYLLMRFFLRNNNCFEVIIIKKI